MPDPYYQDATGTIYQGNVIDVLQGLPDESVQCVVTSPPYWGLRDYGIEPQIWDAPQFVSCKHEWRDAGWKNPNSSGGWQGGAEGGIPNDGQRVADYKDRMIPGSFCLRCGAWRGSLGLEPNPELFVSHIVQVFREVRRVLRKDGVLFLNLGDSYAHSGACGGESPDGPRKPRATDREAQEKMKYRIPPGLKPKDLCGIPWRVAFALQADGWYLRSDIIWSKPNPMPESVTDRPTKSHEYIFLLTKSAKYFWDQEGVREKARYGRSEWNYNEIPIHGGSSLYNASGAAGIHDTQRIKGSCKPGAGGNRNLRSVWTLATQPWKEAHFATFPEAIPERCIKAGTSEKGACSKCGKPWERVVKTVKTFQSGSGRSGNPIQGKQDLSASPTNSTPDIRKGPCVEAQTLGWQPACSCGGDPVPCVVLDPFGGAGTVGLVAEKLNRKWVLVELNPEYCQMARDRILKKAWNVEEGQSNWIQEGLF